MFSLPSIFESAGTVGLLVMGILLLFSILSWTIILAKWQSLNKGLANNSRFIDRFWRTKELDSLVEESRELNKKNNPSAQVFQDGIFEFERQKQKDKSTDNAFLVIERALFRSGRKQIKSFESKLSVLGTIGAISPFIGLFGTVVGIMSSFQQIGRMGNANLSTVAPGIAEALFATALGLFAAIPAVMAYNMFQTKLKTLRADLESFCLDLLAVLKSQK